MKTMFLLGAGASVKAGVPDTLEMTKRLLVIFSSHPIYKKYYGVLSFTVGGLLFQKGKEGKNPYDGVDVEEVFNAVQLLANRQSLEVAPFIGSWNEMIDLFDKISPFNPNVEKFNEEIYRSVAETIINAFPTSSASFSEGEIDRALNKSGSTSLGQAVHKYLNANMKEWFSRMKNKRPHSSFSFKKELTKAIHSADKIPGEGRIFDETCELMIKSLISLVWIKEHEKVSYLKPIILAFTKQNQLCVTTLNYDNSIELLASTNSIECNTGIENWSKTGEFKNDKDSIFLLKLHGSINWKLDRNERSSDRPLPHSRIEIEKPDDLNKKYYRPAVIFGQRNKLTAEGPFLDLMHAFQKELSKNEQVIIIGYSFRDDHINEYLTQWINNSSTNRMVVINPSIDSNTTEFVSNIRDLLPNRIEFINKKVEDVLESICEKIIS
ncbi:MAG: SIR2 family protein [Candidatus Aminicenantes bacterium]|nr:SIR2 family protein [Candidatus Aminicenantes bacterium]